MTIFPARESDLDAVRSLLAAASLPIAGVAENFESFLVARGDDGRLVGVVGLEAYGPVGLLRSLAVESDWRSRGLGKDLVESLLDAARNRGIATMYLLTTTADRYFPRFGFEAVDRKEADPSLQASEEFRGVCPDSAVLMRRRLFTA